MRLISAFMLAEFLQISGFLHPLIRFVVDDFYYASTTLNFTEAISAFVPLITSIRYSPFA